MKARKQSTTSYPILFLMVDSTDHVTGKAGLTPTVTISKNGGAFAAPSGAVTELSSGWYALAGHATDRNTVGELLIHVTGTGADPLDDRYLVVPFDPFDAAGLGMTNLDAAVSTRLATVGYTAPPSAAANAGATLDELLAGHTIPGSAGAALSAAGAAADPLLNSVPGSYAAGSAGAALGRIANEPISVTITSPVTAGGDFEMIVGDDWAVSESRQFDFALTGIVDLTGATVTWHTNMGEATVSKAMSIVTNTATTATIRLTLTASESALWRAGIWLFGIRAVLSNGHVVTLISGGKITVSPAVA